MTEDVFVPTANAFIGALPNFVTQTNATASAVDADKAAAAQSVTDAAAQVALAEAQVTLAAGQVALASDEAGRSEVASLASVGAANFQGEYDAAVTYQIGQSVSFDGGVFVAKTESTGVEPVEGVNWADISGANPVMLRQVFTTSGTFTKNENDLFYYVEAWGGGGSGARYTTTAQGGGGSGGEYVSRYLLASDIGASETVTIAAGGVAISSNGVGNNGGTTTFGAVVEAGGGYGGPTATGTAASLARARNPAVSAANTLVTGSLLFPFASFGGAATGTAGTQLFIGPGGMSIFGGGGGGGAASAAFNVGGVSQFGGDGGAAHNEAGVDGSAPGGGGGASRGTSGAGARGEVRIWTFRRVAE